MKIKNLLVCLSILGFATAIPIQATANGLQKAITQPAAISSSLEQNLNTEQAVQNNKPDKIAVIINGDSPKNIYTNSSNPNQENISLAYQVLLKNNFKVYILDDSAATSGFCPRPYPIHGQATKKNTELILNYLSKKIDSYDTFFLCTTGHGSRKKIVNQNKQATKVSSFFLKVDDLLETELAEYLNHIKPKVGILVFDQCYSGGFAKRTGTGKYTAISASESEGKSFSYTFSRAFFIAWRNKNSDTNKDGKTSIKEAFDYAKNGCSAQASEQTPQLEAQIDPGNVFLD